MGNTINPQDYRKKCQERIEGPGYEGEFFQEVGEHIICGGEVTYPVKVAEGIGLVVRGMKRSEEHTSELQSH